MKLVLCLLRSFDVAALALALPLEMRAQEIGERHGADLRAGRRLGFLDVGGHSPCDGGTHLNLPDPAAAGFCVSVGLRAPLVQGPAQE